MSESETPLSEPGSEPNVTEPARRAWSTRGFEAELALALLVPLLMGLLAASLVPWPEGRWILLGSVSLLTAFLVWLWLRRTLVLRLRRLATALASAPGRAARTGGLDRGFGELSSLAEIVAVSIERRDRLERDLDELTRLRDTLEHVSHTLETWTESEQAPQAFPTGEGPLTLALERVARSVEGRAHETRAVAGLVRETVDDAARRAHGVTAAAERQFVEATSLLTVLRELRRWSGELAQGLDAITAARRPPTALADAVIKSSDLLTAAVRAADVPLSSARAAAMRLAESVALHTAVADDARVATVENAAAALAGIEEAGELHEALRTLARDLADASARARVMELETESILALALEDRGAWEARLARVSAEIAELTESQTAPAAADPASGAYRALDRIHEMVDEALARGEKLVHQAERTSSDALRAGESMRGALDELDGLAARLEPPREARQASGDEAAETPGRPPLSGIAAASGEPTRPLRVLGPGDVIEDEEAGFRG